MGIDRHIVMALKSKFPKGTRVKLVRMEDIQAPPEGTLGTVMFVDDIGTIHVEWDTGSTLGAAYGEDVVERV